jgi:osmotically-inducible protein OsmY
MEFIIMKIKEIIKLSAVLGFAIVLQACAVSDRRTIGSQIDDNSISIKANNAIEGNKTLDQKANINVYVYNGIVLLTGQAPNDEWVGVAGDLVRPVQGVRDVQNQIRVGNPISFTTKTRDSWITTRVKSLLAGDKQVSALNVRVFTENGEVFLMGLVSAAEADKAVEIARHVDGVSRVIKAFETSDN